MKEQKAADKGAGDRRRTAAWALVWIVFGALASNEVGKVAAGERGMAFGVAIGMAGIGLAGFTMMSLHAVRQLKASASIPPAVASAAGVLVSVWFMYHSHANDGRVAAAIAAGGYFLLSLAASGAVVLIGRHMREREQERIKRRQVESEHRRRMAQLHRQQDRRAPDTRGSALPNHLQVVPPKNATPRIQRVP